MKKTIMAAKTAARRKLSYSSLQEIVADANRLTEANAPTTGNWTKGQIFDHLARLMDRSLDGFDFTVAWPIRLIGKYFFKQQVFKKGVAPGYQLKGDTRKALGPEPISDQEGLEHLKQSIQRLETESQRFASPVLGELTRDEWDLLHRRHAELHMSFIAEPTD